MVLNTTGYTVQDLFSRGFKKLVPLAKDSSTPNVNTGGVLEIADEPKFWSPGKLADNYHKFYNIATTFGPLLLSDNTVGYNHCLDVDSEAVRAILEPYLPEIKCLTYIVKTKKGMHIHWIEHEQHERIGSKGAGRRVKRCMPGFDFEIKTDHKGGLAHLPPSKHRKDIKEKVPEPFEYRKLEGSADKVGVIDNFMDSGMGLYDFILQSQILGQHVRDPNAPIVSGKRGVPKSKEVVSATIKMSEPKANPEIEIPSPTTAIALPESNNENGEVIATVQGNLSSLSLLPQEKNPIPLEASDLHFKCADRIYELIDAWYVESYRNQIMLAITGAIRRNNNDISYDDAKHIITKICELANDEECSARLSTLMATYDKTDMS